jgi:hypothetical protein
MSVYIEYELDDGTTILVESKETQAGAVVRASRGTDGNVIIKANKKVSEALDSIKGQAVALRHKLDDMKADEVEVKFSLKSSGEVGNFAIGNVGAEAAYEITLKWANRHEASRE